MKHTGLRRISAVYRFLAIAVVVLGLAGVVFAGMQPRSDLAAMAILAISVVLSALGLYTFALTLKVLVAVADATERTAAALERMRWKE